MCEFLTGMIFVMWQYFLLGMKKNYVSVFFTKMNKLMRKYFEALLIPREDNFHTFHPQIDFQSTFFWTVAASVSLYLKAFEFAPK